MPIALHLCRSLVASARAAASVAVPSLAWAVRSLAWATGSLAVGALALASLSGCSGDAQMVDRLGGLDSETAERVNIFTTQQMQLGYQIVSTASMDNGLEFCFQMCNQSFESCALAGKVCDISTEHPSNGPLAARCEVTRERCRTHRTKVPRQCVCDAAGAAPGA